MPIRVDNIGSASGTGGGNPFTEIQLGDPTVDGSWRIIPVGANLVQQKREGGVWVEKVAATP